MNSEVLSLLREWIYILGVTACHFLQDFRDWIGIRRTSHLSFASIRNAQGEKKNQNKQQPMLGVQKIYMTFIMTVHALGAMHSSISTVYLQIN